MILNTNEFYKIKTHPTSNALDQQGMSIIDYVNLYYTDYEYYLNLHDNPVYILNKTNNIAYLITCSEAEAHFLKSIEYKTNYVVVTELDSHAIVWTVFSNPMLRFCINFKFNSNWLHSRISGHPSGYFQVGRDIVNNAIDNAIWPYRNQLDIINSSNVDYVFYGNILDSIKNWELTRKPDLVTELIFYAKSAPNWNLTYDRSVWPFNDPFSVLKRNQQFLEESVHDILLQNPILFDKLREKYTIDFNLMYELNDGIITETTYEQYWAHRQNGEQYELYS